jgi:hypothetical protein
MERALAVPPSGAAPPRRRFTLCFHDTHHRAVSDPDAIPRFDLDGYDGVLAFGETLLGGLPPLGLGRPGLGLARGRRHASLSNAGAEESATAGRLDRTIGATRSAARRSANSKSYHFALRQTFGPPLDIYGVRYPQHAHRNPQL